MDPKGKQINTLQTGGAKRVVQLSSDLLSNITSNIERGDYQKCRGLIATGLDINDALTEVSLHHMQSTIAKKTLNTNKFNVLLDKQADVTRGEFLEIINEVFGLHGRAADSILKKAGFERS